MTQLEPRVDFANMSDDDIAELGLTAAVLAFNGDFAIGCTNGDSLAIVVGEVIGKKQWVELGRRLIGPDGGDFLKNIDPKTGKLATTIRHCADSILAYYFYGDMIPEGPQRWTGAVYFTARVQTVEHGWMIRHFAGAASGVQGHFDQATVYTALSRMGACWAEKMLAIHGRMPG